jgi:Putative transposase
MTLSPQEFLRRFLQHVLPRGFPRIRYFGWLANRTRKSLLPLCRFLLHEPPPATEASSLNQPTTWPCPLCQGQGPMYILKRLTAAQILFAETRFACSYDSS